MPSARDTYLHEKEKAVFHTDIAAFLECALAVGVTVEGAIIHCERAGAVEGALLVEGFILDNVHFCDFPFLDISKYL